MIGTLTLEMRDENQNTKTENLGNIDANKLIDESTQKAFAQEIDTFGRNIANLTTRTFYDTYVRVSYDITAILAED